MMKIEQFHLPEQSTTPSHLQCGGIQYVLLNIYCPQLIWPASHSGGAEIRKKNTMWVENGQKEKKTKTLHWNTRLKASLNSLKKMIRRTKFKLLFNFWFLLEKINFSNRNLLYQQKSSMQRTQVVRVVHSICGH